MRWGKIGAFAALTVLSVIDSACAADILFSTPGAGKELRRALASSSLLIQARNDKTEDLQELVAAARADYGRLLGVLYEAGRFGGVITISVDGREAAAIPPLAVPDEISRIQVNVDPGPLFRFSEARVEPLPRDAELPKEFAVGQPAGARAIREAASVAIDSWRLEGHAKARVSDQRIVARHTDSRLAARLTVDPGPALRFGEVTVSGNSQVRTLRVHTIAGLEEGRDFDPEEIARAERRLRRAGSFSSVVVEEAEEIAAGDTLPLNIAVVEETPRRFGFGAEYSTIEGARLTGFWLHRNFRGGAERVRVDGEVAGIGGETGGIDYSFGVRYERPATPRADVDLYAEIGVEKLDEPDFTSYIGDFALGFTRYATDDLTVDFGLGYLFSEVEDDFGFETYSLLTLPLGATLDRRDNALNPKRGFYMDLDATPFAGVDDSASGAQINLDARAYKTIGNARQVTTALRLQLGSIVGPDLLESPQFYRFYSGGGGTVRGQGYQSLGIDLGGGSRSGGLSFAGISAEARVLLTEAISVVGFYDWGYIGAESFPDGSGGSHSGAGIGFRYDTGIGPIRFDIATPVSGGTDSSNFYIYVGIGQAF